MFLLILLAFITGLFFFIILDLGTQLLLITYLTQVICNLFLIIPVFFPDDHFKHSVLKCQKILKTLTWE